MAAILSLFAEISTCRGFIKGKSWNEYGSIRKKKNVARFVEKAGAISEDDVCDARQIRYKS